MADNNTLPELTGDNNYTAGQNVPDITDLLKSSPLWDKIKPEALLNDKDVPAPDESADNDGDAPASADGDGNAQDNENVEDTEGEETGEDASATQDTGELPTDDEIDWDYKVPVKVNGEVKHYTLEELRKGYATNQHLSAEGRKIGELRKQLEAERDEKLQALVHTSTIVHAQLEADEKGLSAEYHTVKAAMEKAIEEGDGYEAKELKTKLATVQKAYWDKKTARTELEEQVGQQVGEAKQREQQAQMQYFQENIGKVMPDFTQEKAQHIREFALKEGLSDAVLGQIFDPMVIKVLNDYMVLKSKTSTGAQKRETSTKTVPVKKGTPQKTRQDAQQNNLRGKVLSGAGSDQDHLSFLKGLSTLSKKFG